MRYEKLIASPIGALTIASDGASVTAVRFGDMTSGLSSCALLEQAAEELAEYFAGQRRAFTVQLNAQGTAFQRSVWAALCEIGYGETVSYAQIAERIGNPTACRAVGSANNRNPIPIFIPCHRVIGKNGSLIGYAGGMEIKEFLLRLER